MAKTHRTIESLPSQQNAERSQSKLDWNEPPAKPYTRRAEWQFMRKYSLICGTQPSTPQDNGVFTAVN